MPYYYRDERLAEDPHSLPDVEVFWTRYYHCERCEHTDMGNDPCSCGGKPTGKDYQAASGYFYASGFPGCLWDSDPIGPFDTEEEALADARCTFGDW